MNLKGVTTLHNAANAPGTGAVLHDSEFRSGDNRRDELLIEVSGTSTTFSLQAQVSIDGAVWHNSGDPITAMGLYETAVKAPFFRVNLTAISDGDVTVRAR